jgi:hypothetical protein
VLDSLQAGVRGNINPNTNDASFRVTATSGRAVVESLLLQVPPVPLAGQSFAGSGCKVRLADHCSPPCPPPKGAASPLTPALAGWRWEHLRLLAH